NIKRNKSARLLSCAPSIGQRGGSASGFFILCTLLTNKFVSDLSVVLFGVFPIRVKFFRNFGLELTIFQSIMFPSGIYIVKHIISQISMVKQLSHQNQNGGQECRGRYRTHRKRFVKHITAY